MFRIMSPASFASFTAGALAYTAITDDIPSKELKRIEVLKHEWYN